jgi:16S rRNA (cytidine1402-2'-O)-methyltransferase
MSGKLYVVATPIGNLADFTFRAVEILQSVDLIAAEDTRHIRLLLQHYAIQNQVTSFHQNNEDKKTSELLDKLASGLNIALVSDAGTPLLSDPGMNLVRLARQQGLSVIPIPGPCALIAALSVAGLPVLGFQFEGFLPRTTSARLALFERRKDLTSTWVFYESSHRILAALEDMSQIFESERIIVIARELTKLYETVAYGPLDEILNQVRQDENMQKGEFVVLVDAAQDKPANQALSSEQERILTILLTHCSIKTAAEIAAEITGGRKKNFYQFALNLQNQQDKEIF